MMLFRAHTRLPIEPYWYDVGFRGTVRLENKAERFWPDVHRDVGDVTDLEDPRELAVVSYLTDEPPVAAAAVLNGPGLQRPELVVPKTRDGFDPFPAEYGEFVRRTARRMSELATRAFEVALWRTGARGGPPGIEIYPLQLFWRRQPEEGELVLGSDWQQLPSGIVMVGLPDASFFDLDDSVAPNISLLIDRGTPQPLGHDLLREAWRIHESNPRAAVVVAVAAIDTGVKQFIGNQLPQTEWLLRNLPSPPLHKLLRDLLPTVPSKAREYKAVPALDSSVVRVVREAVEKRNSLVHVGGAEVEREWLAALFRVARRLLYELDYHSGYEWARKVTEEVHPWGREWYGKTTDA
jgi:hypothetical protein